MYLKGGTCLTILQSFHYCPSAVDYHFPLGVRNFCSRHQKISRKWTTQKISRKGTTQLLEGSLGDAHLSDLVSFFCPVTSSTISYRMHLLHISLSPERCCYMKKYPLGTWPAQGRVWQTHPSSLLTHVCALLVCSSLSPRVWMGLAHFWAQLIPFRLWLPQGLNFRYSQGENQWN